MASSAKEQIPSAYYRASGSSRVFGLWFGYVLTHMANLRIGFPRSSLLQTSLDFR